MYVSACVIFFLIIIGYFYYEKSRKRINFSPFRITIYPKWYELLKDYKLVDDEAWKQLDEFYGNKSTECNVFMWGISFAVFKSAENSMLIYDNNRKSFHSEVYFREKIEGIPTN